MTTPPRPRRRVAVAVLVAACLGVGGIGVSAARDGLSYYRTPSELARQQDGGGTVRVGGLVERGSVVESASGSTLVITDGASRLQVSYPGRLPDVIREGEGAVVEGDLSKGGVFEATEVLLRHSNEYGPPPEQP